MKMLVYGTVTHKPWGIPKPNCPKCSNSVTVQAKWQNKNNENAVTWSCCVCRSKSAGPTHRPDWVQPVKASWLKQAYLLPFPVPPYEVEWALVNEIPT